MPAVPTTIGVTDTLVEAPHSPSTVLGERTVRTRIYRGKYSLCAASALPRGTLGTGAEAGFIVDECTYSRERGDQGVLTIRWLAGAGAGGAEGTLPDDEYSLEPFSVNPPVEKFPAFDVLTEEEISWCLIAAMGSTPDERDEAVEWVFKNGTAGAQELLRLKRHGVQSYYLAGLKYKWTSYSWTAPECTRGGFIEVPGGPLADKLPAQMSWLRESDSLAWTGSAFRRERSWVGGPNGHWDDFLYGR